MTAQVSDSAVVEQAAGYLEAFASRLRSTGFEAWLDTAVGVPRSHVVDPAVRARDEDVMAACTADGVWWLWWSWAERVAPVGDLDGAVTCIQRVLGERGA